VFEASSTLKKEQQQCFIGGRREALEVFAGAKGDQEALLEYLVRNPDGAKRWVGCVSTWECLVREVIYRCKRRRGMFQSA
jgi:hypothetical protein